MTSFAATVLDLNPYVRFGNTHDIVLTAKCTHYDMPQEEVVARAARSGNIAITFAGTGVLAGLSAWVFFQTVRLVVFLQAWVSFWLRPICISLRLNTQGYSGLSTKITPSSFQHRCEHRLMACWNSFLISGLNASGISRIRSLQGSRTSKYIPKISR